MSAFAAADALLSPLSLRYLVPVPHLLWRELGGVDAVYDHRSGKTHLLTRGNRAILEFAGSAPRSLAELAAAIEATFDLATEDGSQVADALAARFEELIQRDLLVPEDIITRFDA